MSGFDVKIVQTVNSIWTGLLPAGEKNMKPFKLLLQVFFFIFCATYPQPFSMLCLYIYLWTQFQSFPDVMQNSSVLFKNLIIAELFLKFLIHKYWQKKWHIQCFESRDWTINEDMLNPQKQLFDRRLADLPNLQITGKWSRNDPAEMSNELPSACLLKIPSKLELSWNLCGSPRSLSTKC